MDLLTAYATTHPPAIAKAHDTVLHTECVYTFQSPYTSDEGILVPLTQGPTSFFVATCESLANRGGLYLRIVKKRVAKEKGSEEAEKCDSAKPSVLGVGVPGGFAADSDKYTDISRHSVVLLDDQQPNITAELEYNDATKASFPESIQESVDSIIHHAGWTTQQAAAASWQLQDEAIPASKFANGNLPFVDNGVTISPEPSSWKCATGNSDDTTNTWLNLSDGHLGGGRKHWDGTGGTNGALDHYNETGKQYPLVVKLGTITTDAAGNVTADCYSYDAAEEGPVLIPNLGELLAKRGIQVQGL